MSNQSAEQSNGVNSNQPLTVSNVRTLLKENTSFKHQFDNDPEATLKLVDSIANAVTGSVLQKDVWVYRMVVGGLGLVALTIAIGGILPGVGASLSDGIIALGSAAVGGLVGVLVPSPTGVDHSAKPAPQPNTWIPSVIVIVLAVVLLLVVGAEIVYWIINKSLIDPPESIVALGSAALGGLVGVLVPAPEATTKTTKKASAGN